MRAANIALNEALNSNDAMHIAKNEHLTTMGAQYSMVATSCRKADLPQMGDKDTNNKGLCT